MATGITGWGRAEKTPQRSWLGLEIAVVLASIVFGGAFQYWLSAAVPLDASEFAVLSEASLTSRDARLYFIRFNGISLLLFYLVARRSVGVVAALTLLLGIQTSVAIQDLALRIYWSSLVILLCMLVLVYGRYRLPAWQVPRGVAVALSVVLVLLVMRGLYHGVTFPARIDAIRHETTGNADALHASLVACGGGDITPLDRLRECRLSWPHQRSLEQQEALLDHAQALSTGASIFDGSGPAPDRDARHVAIFDSRAAALFVVSEGEREAIARRVVGSAR